jgi:hypothetical protein
LLFIFSVSVTFQLDLNFAILNSDSEGFKYTCLGIDADSSRHIERPAMPWADNNRAIELAISERSPTVWALVIRHKELTGDIIECEGQAIRCHHLTLARTEFIGVGDRNEGVWHIGEEYRECADKVQGF